MRKCENRFGKHLREKCLDSRKTKILMTRLQAARFVQYSAAAATMRTIRDRPNRATVLKAVA